MSCLADGQGQKPVSLFDTLYSFDTIKLTLTYPFDSLYKGKHDEIPSSINIETEKGFLLKDIPITMLIRGKFRRMKCAMPPLLLNFKKSTLRDMQLSNVNEIKLVTHCLNKPEGQENLQEERMCYQLYESLTPYAYRTIWLSVTYADASGRDDTITSAGFLLEPDKDISSRLAVMERKVFNISQDSLHYDSYGLATAFNFLIGNRDWSVVSSRNAKLFYDSLQSRYIVIPYDFDYSNVVGASYRRETLTAPMVHSYDRLYSGEYFKERSGEILKSFLLKENTLMGVLTTATNPMPEERRSRITKYFKDWFDYIRKCKPNDLSYGLVLPYKGGL
jgi:hypothetical protein